MSEGRQRRRGRRDQRVGRRAEQTTRRARWMLAGTGLVALCLPADAVARAEEAPAPTASETAVVASVYDGDTLTLVGGRRVRLLQIDTPELSPSECHGKRSRKLLVAFAGPGRHVLLRRDQALDDRDRYGRLLRYVLVNGRNVNLELVRRGAATPYFYRGERGRHAASLLKAVSTARAHKRGIWKRCRVVYEPTKALTTLPKIAVDDNVKTRCHPNYSPCLPIVDDLDCADIPTGKRPVVVKRGNDPYRLDGDGDGIACL